MTVVVSEKAGAAGGHDRRTVTFYVKDDAGGTVTPEAAVNAAWAAADATYYGLPKVDYSYDELGTDRYDVQIVYAPRSLSIVKPEPSLGGSGQLTFATGLESVNIRTSLGTTGYADAAQLPTGVTTAYDFQGAINVDVEGRVQGTTVQVPVTRLKYRRRFSDTSRTAYQPKWESYASTVNNDIFDTRAAGSLRFDGASGSLRAEGDWDIEFNFSFRPNQTGLTIGNIASIDADGWDLIWPYFLAKDTGARGFAAPTPAYVYVEKIYERKAFADLGVL